MEVPNKIYLQEPIKVRTERLYDNDVEFIRSDAFIEKACEYITNNMRCDGYTLQTKAKFIKEFRSYMKGE